MKRRAVMSLMGAAALAAPLGLWTQAVRAADGDRTKFRRIPTQFIAALADPMANSGKGAQSWGLWPVDPGPRGVALSRFAQLLKNGGVAPEGWKFDNKDWWLEEHGLIMEPPQFPARAGKFLVTGERDVVTSLTIHPADRSGDSRWELGDRATLYDVTHLGCRAARYTPASDGTSCSPANARKAGYPVEPGGQMPLVPGCAQKEYAVLIVIGVALQA